MKKQILAVTLAMAMALSTCACGDVSNESSEQKTSESQVVSSNVETNVVEEDDSVYPIVKEGDEPITIKIATNIPDTTKGEERKIWQRVEEITGINIEWDFIDSAALSTYMAQKPSEWPDMFHMVMNATIVNDYGVYGGRFVNYLDKLDIMPNLAQTFEDYPEARKVVTLSNGEAYNTPYIAKAVTDISSRLFYRTDMMEELGIEVPKTVEEFKNSLVLAKEKYGKPQWLFTGATRNGASTGDAYPIFGAFGTANDMMFDNDENGKVSYSLATEQAKLFYKFMNELWDEELIHEEYVTMDGPAIIDYERKDCLYLFTASERMTTEDFPDGEFHLGCVGPLSSEYDNTLTLPGRISAKNAHGFYINSDSEYVDEICKIVDIAYATEEVVEGSGLYGVSFTWGIEGEDWQFTGDSYEFLTPAEYNGSNNTYVTQEVRYMNVGRYDAFDGMVTTSPGNGQARQTAFANDVWPYVEEPSEVFPIQQLTFTEDEQAVIDQYWTEINTYAGQMQTEFIQGISDIDAKWDEYISNLKAMHLDDVVAVYQAAYDRWLAK